MTEPEVEKDGWVTAHETSYTREKELRALWETNMKALAPWFRESFEEWCARQARHQRFMEELDRDRVAAGYPTVAEALKAEARKARTDASWEPTSRARMNIPFDYALHPPQRRDPVVGAVVDLMASIPWTIHPDMLAHEAERVSSPEHVAAEARFDALNKKP